MLRYEYHLEEFINRLESLPDKTSPDILEKFVLEMGVREVPINEYVSFSN